MCVCLPSSFVDAGMGHLRARVMDGYNLSFGRVIWPGFSGRAARLLTTEVPQLLHRDFEMQSLPKLEAQLA